MPFSGTVGGPDACALAFKTAVALTFFCKIFFCPDSPRLDLNGKIGVNRDGQKNTPSLLFHYVSNAVRTKPLLHIMIFKNHS